MIEPEIQATSDTPRGKPPVRPTRTCVGCGERVDMGGAVDLVRLIIGPAGEVAVDARGGGFGRGAHVHARPECLRRAAERGLSRSAKARVHTLQMETGEARELSAGSLAAAIRHAQDRRIEGLLIAATRSRRLVLGSDAVTFASQRGEVELVVVATDAAAAADLTAVRRAVAEGRGVAWGTKERLGAALLRGKAEAGLGVLAITSRSLAIAVRDAVRIADNCAAVAGAGGSINASTKGSPPEDRRKMPRKDRSSSAPFAEGGKSQAGGACAPEANSGKLVPPAVAADRRVAASVGIRQGRPPRQGPVRRGSGYDGAGSGQSRESQRGSQRGRRNDG